MTIKAQQDHLICDSCDLFMSVSKSKAAKDRTQQEIKINKNGCNFFNMHEELNSVWVESLTAGNTFLAIRAVRATDFD